MNSKTIQIRSLANQIIEAGRRHKSLYLYGKPHDQGQGGDRINHVYTNIAIDNKSDKPEDSLQILAQVFDVIPTNVTLDIHIIFFGHYSTSSEIKLEFPPNLGRVMPNVKYCNVNDCINLSSLDSIVEQFLDLNVLNCKSCNDITSLECLSSIPDESLLTKVCFDECGLQTTTGEDDWTNGFISLGSKRRNSHDEGITFYITECNLLTHLPPSIKFLGADRNIKVHIFLSENEALRKLPHELGEIKNLSSLFIFDCPKLQNLPWTLGRFPECNLCFGGEKSNELLKVMQNVKWTDSEYGEACMSELQPYFKESLQRFFIGIIRLKILLHREGQLAIERLYRPGGKGFQKSQDRFYRLVRKEHE